MDLIYFILIGTTLGLVYYMKVLGGVIGLSLLIVKVLYDIGYLRSIKIYKGTFVEGTYFYKEYTGTYSKINQESFAADSLVISKFKLEKSMGLCCIYYDNPAKTPEGKQRYIIGLYHKKTTTNDKQNEDLEKYTQENGYKKIVLPTAVSLFTKWDYVNQLSLLLGNNKFYSHLNESLKDMTFVKQFNIKSDTYKCSLEIYSDSSITFFIPLMKQELFMIHSGLEKLTAE